MTTLEHVIHISRIDAAIEVVNIQTGVCVSLTSTDKCIYAFMRNRVKFFGNSGKDYYDNIEFIAALQGLSEKTVRNTIAKLREVGCVVVSKKRTSRGVSNSYRMLDLECDLLFRFTMSDIAKKYFAKECISKEGRKKKEEKYQPRVDDDDEFDEPF